MFSDPTTQSFKLYYLIRVRFLKIYQLTTCSILWHFEMCRWVDIRFVILNEPHRYITIIFNSTLLIVKTSEINYVTSINSHIVIKFTIINGFLIELIRTTYAKNNSVKGKNIITYLKMKFLESEICDASNL